MTLGGTWRDREEDTPQEATDAMRIIVKQEIEALEKTLASLGRP